MTGGHWLQYEKKGNFDIVWDPSHGAWNDIKNSAKDANYLQFLLSLLLVWNLPHGPWAEDYRSSQVKEMVDTLCKEEFATPPPLLLANAANIFKESERPGFAADPDSVQILWDDFRNDNPFRKKGAKISLNRFMSLVQQGKQEKKVWLFT